VESLTARIKAGPGRPRPAPAGRGPDPRRPITLGRREEPPGAFPGVGSLVLDRYRLLACLGAGGFGVVWSAHDELLHREVAVKRVPLSPDGDSERATREALASARLAHPAIVALYEACAVNDAFYLISELINGRTLAQLIAARSTTDEQVLGIGVALAGALEHAHSRGVIHRDVKPQNVLVPDAPPDGWAPSSTPAAVAKLADFGGASLAGEDVLTRTGDVMGTLAYMAPEQSEGREAREPADLYSLALVLYEALCGVNPVRGATPAATARKIGGRIEALGRRRRDLPRSLTRALDVALAPSPESRGTLTGLSDALEDALEQGLPGARRRPRRRGTRAEALGAPLFDAPTAPPSGAAAAHPATRAPIAPHPVAGEGELEASHEPACGGFQVPRGVWLAGALAAIVWQAWIGRAGLSLLIFAAILPVAVLPAGRRTAGRGLEWMLCALAPLLGLLGLAAAFPAIAGQPRGWRQRASLAALGYWWLTLAEPLAGRRLWLGEHGGIPARSVWETSLASSATHVVGPAIALGVLLGALLWAAAAVALPWMVRGRSAPLDALAAAVWAGALFAAAPALDSGLAAHAAQAGPRGAVVGAVLGGALAVAARALRGPV
jgi:serine/threonine protein kinase